MTMACLTRRIGVAEVSVLAASMTTLISSVVVVCLSSIVGRSMSLPLTTMYVGIARAEGRSLIERPEGRVLDVEIDEGVNVGGEVPSITK